MRNNLQHNSSAIEGVFLVDKPKGKTSFSLIAVLRKILNVRTIGHAGTLDPMATGVMVLLVGRNYTTRSGALTGQDKGYEAEITLGVTTDTYDAEGEIIGRNTLIPTLEQIQTALQTFQGTVEQTPPMFSAKKVQGQRLYDLARKGQEVERKKCIVQMECKLVEYSYPLLKLSISCSKGTYVRSIAHDLGALLGCGGHLSALTRTKSGNFLLENCFSGETLFSAPLAELRELIIPRLIDKSSLV